MILTKIHYAEDDRAVDDVNSYIDADGFMIPNLPGTHILEEKASSSNIMSLL